MKIQNRITFIAIILTLVFVFISNYAFSQFFSNYLMKQEESQIISINISISSFISDKLIKYQGTTNDWSHWDDTYAYVNDNNQTYVDRNLNDDTFKDLDLSFIVIAGNDNLIRNKQFYDIANKNFTQFPADFIEDINKFIGQSNSKEDTSSILKLGDQFYFVASSQITDSNKEKPANGRMLIGRVIDVSSISKLEEMTDSRINLSTANNVSDKSANELSTNPTTSIKLHQMRLSDAQNSYLLDYLVTNADLEDSSVMVSLTKNRNLYFTGMKQIHNFLLIYAISIFFMIFALFTLLGQYISQPFKKLISEVKSLDLTTIEIQKLKIYGKDEFAFLRNSINNMLGRIEAEQYKVKENEEKLFSTLKSVGDGVIAVDNNGMVDFLNPVAQILTGWGQEEAYGKPFETVFNIINEYTGEKVENPVQKVFELQETIELANHTILVSQDGVQRAIEDTAAPIKDRFGKIIGVVLVFRDFSDKKQKRLQIEYLSYHDQLTGLYNRRFFEEELKRLDTVRNLPLSIIFADINGLKTINDAFGHQQGDQLIQQVAEVMKAECRADDIIARTGGDEFIMLLPQTDSASAQELMNRFKKNIELKKIMGLNISISFGSDTKNAENQSAWDILKNAEDLMYQKKILESSSKRSAVIRSILNTLHVKSPQEEAHSQRVSLICESIAKTYNLSEDEVRELKAVGELHDIGKITIDEVTLNKAGTLSESEWAKMKQHPEIGYRLLGTSSEYYDIADYVLAHHERWDGTGYPRGLKGEAIPWKARIITIADAYDVMTTGRPYRKPLNEAAAVAEIRANAGTQFDPAIARVFVEKVLGLTWE